MICPSFPPFLLAPVGLVAYGGWFLPSRKVIYNNAGDSVALHAGHGIRGAGVIPADPYTKLDSNWAGLCL